MSALAAAASIVPVGRTKLNELSATREISHFVAEALEADAAITFIARTALRIPGIYRVQIGPNHWGRVPEGAQAGSAVYGPVRVFFDLHTIGLETPVRFARFISEQVAHVYSIAELLAANRQLFEHSERIKRVIARRKTLQRARAILGNRENLDDAAALRRLIEYSRRRRRSLHEVAEAILLSEATITQRPFTARPF